ncbi:MAG: hypothetical protein E7254_00640 [Lachnospiraceae bacterium]|nr:hypothetical protein [Lachnospiraceae bacterium]
MKQLKKVITIIMIVALVVGVLPVQDNCVLAKDNSTKTTFYGDNYEITYDVTTMWATGYNVDIKIKNTGDKIIDGWYLVFEQSNKITNIWNASKYLEMEDCYVFSNTDYNYKIESGETINFGFTCEGSFEAAPKDFLLCEPIVMECSEDYEVTYEECSDWLTGFVGNIHIKNNSSNDITAWNLSFDTDVLINGMWNADVKEKSETGYILNHLSYNRIIKPNEEVIIGITGSYISSLSKADKIINPVLYCIPLTDSDGETSNPVVSDEERAKQRKECEELLKIDTDNDGINDFLEKYFELDPDSEDTDGDGLSDYIEINDIITDAKLIDTDNDGILDGDEDSDEDGLTNIEEIRLNTNCGQIYSDLDSITDGEEVLTYHTDPLKEDTDGDGVDDGTEVELGTNPLEKEESFDVTVNSEEEDTVKVSVEVELKGEQVSSLTVEKLNDIDLFPKTMPGYIGDAYEFSCEGEFEEATLSFEFDEKLLEDNDFDPVIYYFNEEDQRLEALETTVTGNVATAKTPHFSTYILVNRKIYEDSLEWIDVWDIEGFKSIEVELVFDNSALKSENDMYEEYRNLMISKANEIIESLPENTKVGLMDYYSTSSNYYNISEGITDVDSILQNAYSTESNNGYTIVNALKKSFNYFNLEDDSVKKIEILFTSGYNGGVPNSFTQETVNNNVTLCSVTIGYDPNNISKSFDKVVEATGGVSVKSYLTKYFTDSDTDISDDVDNQIIFVNSLSSLEEQKDAANIERKIMEAQPKYTKFGVINAYINSVGAPNNAESLLRPTNDINSVLKYINARTNFTGNMFPYQYKITYGLKDAINGFNVGDSRTKKKIVIITSITNKHSIESAFFGYIAYNGNDVQVNVIFLETHSANNVYKTELENLAKNTGGSVITGKYNYINGKDELFHTYYSGYGGVIHPFDYRWKCDVTPIKEFINLELINNNNSTEDLDIDSDNDNIPDYYEKNGVAIFNGIKLKTDYLNPDTDNDGVTDDKELAKIELEYNEDRTKVTVRGKIISNPLLKDSDYDGIVDSKDSYPYSNKFKGSMKRGSDDKINKLSFEMDYRWFLESNEIYNSRLSKMSVLLANSIYDGGELTVNGEGSYDTAGILRHFGMKNVKSYDIGNKKDVHRTEIVLGWKEINVNGTFTNVITVVVRGTNATIAEWSSNFEVGNKARFDATKDDPDREWITYDNHEGFDIAANRIRKIVDKYVEECKEKYIHNDGSFAYWVTGHSRGGGIANVIGAYYEKEGKKSFTYTFASPNTTMAKDAEDYKTIFNIINSDDFIPRLPLEIWGYRHYGQTARHSILWDFSNLSEWCKSCNKPIYNSPFLGFNLTMHTLYDVVPKGDVRERAYDYYCYCHNKSGDYLNVFNMLIMDMNYISYSLMEDYLSRYKNVSQYSEVEKQVYIPLLWYSVKMCEQPAFLMQYLATLMGLVCEGDYVEMAAFMLNVPLGGDYNSGRDSVIWVAIRGVEHPHFVNSYYVLANNVKSSEFTNDHMSY